MMDPRVFALTSLLIAAGASQATAQVFGVTPRPQSPQIPSVCEGFVPLRQEAETGMAALKAATDRKAAREEFCQLFTKISGSTAKMAKFLEQHQAQCNVPVEAIQRARADHGKILTYRKQACSTASAPAGPRLSDVLGAPLLPDSTQNKPNDGIFNTMTGNPLTR